MGFFSSRRAESVPLPKTHDAKPITSKWYGKLRKKDSPNTSPQPNSDGWIEVASPTPATAQRSAPPVAADPVTRTLASRLNELATSYADGLISDDEYRILRQDIFERYGTENQAGHSHLRASQRTARDPQAFSRSPLPSFTPDMPVWAAPESITPSSPLTVFKNSLRRTASRSSNKSGSVLPNADSSASIFSFRSNSTITVANSARNASSNTLSTQNTPLAPSLNKSADLLSISSRQSGAPSIAPSSRSRAPPSAYRGQVAPSWPSNGPLRQTLPDNDEDKSAAQLRRELAEVELEGMRVLEGFDAREAILLEEVEGMHLGLGLGVSFSTANGASVGPSLPPVDSAATIKPRKRNSLIDVLPLRSAFKVPAHLPDSSLPTQHPSNPPPPHLLQSSPITEAVLTALEPDPKLVEALAEVRRSRAQVKHRYEARMAYLRAKLKGAELHEKLLR